MHSGIQGAGLTVRSWCTFGMPDRACCRRGVRQLDVSTRVRAGLVPALQTHPPGRRGRGRGLRQGETIMRSERGVAARQRCSHLGSWTWGRASTARTACGSRRGPSPFAPVIPPRGGDIHVNRSSTLQEYIIYTSAGLRTRTSFFGGEDRHLLFGAECYC